MSDAKFTSGRIFALTLYENLLSQIICVAFGGNKGGGGVKFKQGSEAVLLRTSSTVWITDRLHCTLFSHRIKAGKPRGGQLATALVNIPVLSHRLRTKSIDSIA